MKNIFIYKKIDSESENLASTLTEKLLIAGFNVEKTFTPQTDMTIVVGGDGAFLKAVRATNFSAKPILGINNGHLGFFADFEASELDEVVEVCKTENYIIQKHKVIQTIVEGENDTIQMSPALNDVAVKKSGGSLIHLNVSIGENFIEKFSGDGILISSSAGSTAYNYSLGGSIVDPQLNLLQITPMAPANNTAYRSFTSSLLLPGKEKIEITPDDATGSSIIVDGEEHNILEFKKISISLSEDEIQIVRRPDYSFWSKVKSKFL